MTYFSINLVEGDLMGDLMIKLDCKSANIVAEFFWPRKMTNAMEDARREDLWLAIKRRRCSELNSLRVPQLVSLLS
jgi:hypothetical protein